MNGATDATISHRGLQDVDPWAHPSPPADPAAAWPRHLRGVSETLEVIALALIMFMGVRLVVHNYVVDGRSMEPTFDHGDLVIVNRLAYSSFDLSWIPGVSTDDWRPFGEPSYGDVVVFTFDQRDGPRDFIKRVIGLPGDVISVQDGLVVLNGEPLDEPYVSAPVSSSYGPEEVPPGHIFVLGDNRNNSFDSRAFGMIEQDAVIGRAELRYWPLNHASLIDHSIGAPLLDVEVVPSAIAR